MRYFLLALLIGTIAQADLISITPAQKLHAQVNNMSTAMFNQLLNGGNQLYRAVWQNPDTANLSPCQAFAALGTDAVASRMSFAALSSFLNGIVPGVFAAVENPAYTLTNNLDGSVSCVAPSPSPSPSPTPGP